jgi:uncharacterized protein YdhG (YjbR/CyaY superfamily)
LRATIKETAPSAIEGISYRMPYYDYKGQLVWFALMSHTLGFTFGLHSFKNTKKN